MSKGLRFAYKSEVNTRIKITSLACKAGSMLGLQIDTWFCDQMAEGPTGGDLILGIIAYNTGANPGAKSTCDRAHS